MFIREYHYIKPTVKCEDHYEIEGIDRTSYATSQFIDRAPEIVLDRKTAVLYAPGTGISQSESRDPTTVNSRYKGTVGLCDGGMLIKELTSYHIHRWIGNMVNNEFVEYASTNGNACASSMFSLYEAERLLQSGDVAEVIIISEERTSFNTIRIFKEHNIPLIVGDGLAIVRLVRDSGLAEIDNTKWKFEWNRNPFGVTVSGYDKVNSECATVKPHGTGTGNNTDAEVELVQGRRVINYKKDIGHTQGASALLELCMLMDDETVQGDVLCVASGLGNVYGSCILHKG